ncbi:UvrD-helicase domain-containing protein [Variovorax sp. LjRoot178]|uniref:UvrD-helicase domain-containing protein n=1 Tax=Variovorax sp. LjRoot178 TaxID=3342277 RepID=UPI003ECE3C13
MAILPPPPGSAKPAAVARPQPAEQTGGGGTAALIERARTLRFQFDQKARAQSVVFQAARAAADAAAVTTPGAVRRTVKYDENQQQLIDAKDHIVIGEAVAGSGKTTTAVGYAAARPHEKMIYLCFGRANADEARQRFPSNVDVFNVHSLAFNAIGHKFKDRLVKSWRPRDIAEQLGVENRIAGCIGKTLASFYSSVDSEINESHLAVVADWGLTPMEEELVLGHGRSAWQKIIAPGSTMPVTHDTYLKLWTMSGPRLNYDCMILDEAQDTNPLTEQLVMAQLDHCRLLAIGDRHQSIFGFRGATNAMQNLRAIEGSRVVTMPRTWRFGPRTADVANKILQNLKGESIEIQGMGKDTGWGRQSTLLTRTNSGLFEEAVSRQGRGVHWLGGVENYNLDVIVDAYNIWARSLHAVRAPFMKRFRSWNEFVDYSESSRDAETRMLIKVVERHEHKIPQLVAQVKKHEVKDPAAAELTLTTLHKSKGMEWDCVRIGNDFEFLFEAEKEICETGELSKATEQEVHLLYVGITRARGMCKLNDETEQWLKELPQLQAERTRAIELMNSAGASRPAH